MGGRRTLAGHPRVADQGRRQPGEAATSAGRQGRPWATHDAAPRPETYEQKPFRGTGSPNVAWTFDTGGPIEAAPAMLDDGTIVVASLGGALRARRRGRASLQRRPRRPRVRLTARPERRCVRRLGRAQVLRIDERRHYPVPARSRQRRRHRSNPTPWAASCSRAVGCCTLRSRTARCFGASRRGASAIRRRRSPTTAPSTLARKITTSMQ